MYVQCKAKHNCRKKRFFMYELKKVKYKRKINKTYEIFKEQIKEKLLKYGFAKKGKLSMM